MYFKRSVISERRPNCYERSTVLRRASDYMIKRATSRGSGNERAAIRSLFRSGRCSDIEKHIYGVWYRTCESSSDSIVWTGADTVFGWLHWAAVACVGLFLAAWRFVTHCFRNGQLLLPVRYCVRENVGAQSMGLTVTSAITFDRPTFVNNVRVTSPSALTCQNFVLQSVPRTRYRSVDFCTWIRTLDLGRAGGRKIFGTAREVRVEERKRKKGRRRAGAKLHHRCVEVPAARVQPDGVAEEEEVAKEWGEDTLGGERRVHCSDMASLAISIAKNEFIVGGKYRLMRKIGSGSFGDIYLGINISNGEVRKPPYLRTVWPYDHSPTTYWLLSRFVPACSLRSGFRFPVPFLLVPLWSWRRRAKHSGNTRAQYVERDVTEERFLLDVSDNGSWWKSVLDNPADAQRRGETCADHPCLLCSATIFSPTRMACVVATQFRINIRWRLSGQRVIIRIQLFHSRILQLWISFKLSWTTSLNWLFFVRILLLLF